MPVRVTVRVFLKELVIGAVPPVNAKTALQAIPSAQFREFFSDIHPVVAGVVIDWHTKLHVCFPSTTIGRSTTAVGRLRLRDRR